MLVNVPQEDLEKWVKDNFGSAYSEPFVEGGQVWAFPLNGVMPVPIGRATGVAHGFDRCLQEEAGRRLQRESLAREMLGVSLYPQNRPPQSVSHPTCLERAVAQIEEAAQQCSTPEVRQQISGLGAMVNRLIERFQQQISAAFLAPRGDGTAVIDNIKQSDSGSESTPSQE
jgi:hypothetical protein